MSKKQRYDFDVGIEATSPSEARMAILNIIKDGNLHGYVLEVSELVPCSTKGIKASPALQAQVGGSHYKDLPIQPVEFCQKNRLNYCESAVVKYVSRHREKGKAEDVKKAIHFLNLLLELEYPESK